MSELDELQLRERDALERERYWKEADYVADIYKNPTVRIFDFRGMDLTLMLYHNPKMAMDMAVRYEIDKTAKIVDCPRCCGIEPNAFEFGSHVAGIMCTESGSVYRCPECGGRGKVALSDRLRKEYGFGGMRQVTDSFCSEL